jgi:hypothetical protein
MPENLIHIIDVIIAVFGIFFAGLTIKDIRWYRQHVTGISPLVARVWRWRAFGGACGAATCICIGFYGMFRGSAITDWLLFPGWAATCGVLVARVRTEYLEHAIRTYRGPAKLPRARQEPAMTATSHQSADDPPRE